MKRWHFAGIILENEHEDLMFEHGDESATLYEHCVRAIRKNNKGQGTSFNGGGGGTMGWIIVGKDSKGECMDGLFLIACLNDFAEVFFEKMMMK